MRGSLDAPVLARDISFPAAPAARVFHFVQGQAANVLKLLDQIPAGDYVLALSYDRPVGISGPRHGFERDAMRVARFWPGSTWAQGRNLAWQVALALGERIDYAAFLDDDVVFERGSYAAFIGEVLSLRPFIAVPLVPRTNQPKFVLPGRAVQAGSTHDQQIMLFHPSVLADRDVWPMIDDHDRVSWQVSCAIQEYAIGRNYHGKLAQFNNFIVGNDGHVWENPGSSGSGYVMDHDIHKIRRLAVEIIAAREGFRPRLDNDAFSLVRGLGPSEKIRRLWWRNLGRRRLMRRLETLAVQGGGC